ncbi:unnamed protein product [Cyprideis torosa]|uniref:Uncharacterized protein n=1 Tax=Cyprideis torosa TaxID=163714 RepID=A0A7R8W4U7_9CRUS|nr:unnamed protein product [Cyprideis torosa]CAG0880967.1 unnamed protein product [Cyprideis torosa]
MFAVARKDLVFPSEWQGDWFIQGYQTVFLNDTYLSSHGLLVDGTTVGGKFVLNLKEESLGASWGFRPKRGGAAQVTPVITPSITWHIEIDLRVVSALSKMVFDNSFDDGTDCVRRVEVK